ncbi:uncharacterized protein [Elaeis guineensis]|uniref:uncharacterized protein isoform X1 n=2 Tax=Elaeis guineensis var. tenera TaxID=51953 RepID=UPI003C6D7F37
MVCISFIFIKKKSNSRGDRQTKMKVERVLEKPGEREMGRIRGTFFPIKEERYFFPRLLLSFLPHLGLGLPLRRKPSRWFLVSRPELAKQGLAQKWRRRIRTIDPMVQMMMITSSLRVLQLCVMNLSEMTKVPRKLTMRWRSFTRKSRSKSLRRVMVKSQQNLRHSFLMHCRACVENSSHKFEDGWSSDRLNLSWEKKKTEMTGLSIGVASMKNGERALLHVGWELGYRKEASFSFPNVPPMADPLYEVGLIGYDEPKKGKPKVT